MKSTRDRILESLSEVDSLPLPSQLFVRLISEARDESVSKGDFSKTINSTARLRSYLEDLFALPSFAPNLAFSEKVTTHLAVERLGKEALLEILLPVGIIEAFERTPKSNSFNDQGFWEHSVCTGLAADVLTTMSPVQGLSRQRAFLAGFCHDLGKCFLATKFPAEYHDVREKTEIDGRLILESEADLLEIGHDEIGALFGAHWRLPESVISAIRWHHSPKDCPDTEAQPLAFLTTMANFITNHQGLGESGNARVPKIPNDAFEALELKAEVIPEIIEAIQDRIQDAGLLVSVAAKTN